MSLKEVKAKIRSVQKVHQVTKAMEAVSAVKMRRSQCTAIEARPFALHALGLLRRLLALGIAKNHPLVYQRTLSKRYELFIVITSDRGLAGALNSYVFKKVYARIAEKKLEKEQVSIFAIGKKGYEHFSRRGFHMVGNTERWGEGVIFGDPQALAENIITRYLKEEVTRITLVYNNFESTFVQEPVVRRLLPLSFPAIEEVVAGIVPVRGKYSSLRSIALKEAPTDYLFEPDARAVLDELLPYLVGVVLYHAVLEANASEHSARMVAMKSASDRARDIGKELVRAFNKERQTAITAEVSEITSGIEAMK